MKLLAFFALVGVVATVSVNQPNLFEDYDIPKFFADEERSQNAINCIIETDSCTEEAQTIKDAITEAVTNNCAHCSVIQLQKLQEAYTALFQKDKETANLLVKKLDPTGKFTKFNMNEK